MRTALLTRPLPVRDGMAAYLDAANAPYLCAPTLSVTAHVDAVFEARLMRQNYDGVVLVSQHAAHFAAQRLSALQYCFPAKTWLATVGQASAQAIVAHWLDAQVIQPARDDTQDSEGLWRALTPHINPQHNILIVRAQIGRDVLLHRLENKCANVDVWSCYRRDALRWNERVHEQVAQALHRHGLVLVITSIEGLNALLTQYDGRVPAQLWTQPVVTLHPSIAQAATDHGFTRVDAVAPHDMAAAVLARQMD